MHHLDVRHSWRIIRAHDGTMPSSMLTREHVVWAYRLLLDRDPENEDVIGPKLAGSRDTTELRHHLITSAEFQTEEPAISRTRTIGRSSSRARAWRAPVRRSLRSRDRTQHRARPLRSRRSRVRAKRAAARRYGDRRGAHIGFFTMQMAAMVGPRGRVFAFEPLDRNADLLERSIAENRFGDRIVFRRAAVGALDRHGDADLPCRDAEYRRRIPAAQTARRRSQATSSASVPLVALDDARSARPVRFIKIDVEGAEPQVIRGARRLLKEDRPLDPLRAAPDAARTRERHDGR